MEQTTQIIYDMLTFELQEMREAFESEAKKTGKDRLLITMAVPASLEYAGKVRACSWM